ncbi:NADP-dependent phosphogluconate dehydrogenase [Jeotgalibaca sp. MA1X17-3]|uniref:NADP-dependent phosphogluconate dehydrogenase n=1 Tax=Jeotgalibaca sp. MA1X17-3 TaxID=2908211 RepID=UPI001F484BBD|nr:NADP-dependent phosphogluconate dehydrogenase [Jeotgalibaca sp. MA1X17-3]UJF15975.1 NADP-dependent phosphogluconate dehydrogenase [Jeotgalibaca sp. MA1X17-3]
MHISIVGLGKMGLSLAKQLNGQGKIIQGFDLNPAISDVYSDESLIYLSNLEELANSDKQNVVFLVLPTGEPTKQTIHQLSSILNKNDIIIDFSNSFYKDSIKNYNQLDPLGILYYDCGLSGGVEGALNGACMMLGGPEKAPSELLSLLASLCVSDGFSFYPQPGSGHYLKMVHNGIEYGMMQSIAEGLELLNEQNKFIFDLNKVTTNWSNGSIIESSLLKNIKEELKKDPQLSAYDNKVHASGEAKWMVGEALEEEVPVPVISLSLMKRNASLLNVAFSNQVLSAMRFNFGGHKEY